jgi:putative spermidine/putrescine transport system substrate-binding protein
VHHPPRTTALRRAISITAAAAITTLGLAACSAPAVGSSAALGSWDDIVSEANGQTVNLWMWGGDEQGNSYIDDVLAPAAADLGVTLNRVPIADTKDALNRVFSELQAGRTDGSVDLVWVNGDNFRTGREADAWLCDWTRLLPNMALTAPEDPLLSHDFGTPIDGCEAPWSKAQFSFVYNADTVENPPTSLAGILDWARAHPGRFTYPAPPDFTGSVFIREALYSQAGGYERVPSEFDQAAYDELAPALFDELAALRPALWRGGETYPQDSVALDTLFSTGEVDFTMTYGPATLDKLVADGTFPPGTRVLTLDEGTVGNASFLGIPVNAAHRSGAMVVANLALSAQQQAAKADPRVWGQFTTLDLDRLPPEELALFTALPSSAVLPPYDELSANANPELGAQWVPALDEGWRTKVLPGQ